MNDTLDDRATADASTDADPEPRTLEVLAEGRPGDQTYTFVPPDATEEKFVTTWITARERDVVDLEKRR